MWSSYILNIQQGSVPLHHFNASDITSGGGDTGPQMWTILDGRTLYALHTGTEEQFLAPEECSQTPTNVDLLLTIIMMLYVSNLIRTINHFYQTVSIHAKLTLLPTEWTSACLFGSTP